MYRLIPCAIALATTLLLASCASTPPPPPAPVEPRVSLNVQPTEITIAKPGTGEPTRVHEVTLTLRAQAPANTGIDAPLPSTQVYDFYVMYSGVEVWRWSQDKEFFQQATPFELPAGTGLTFTAQWMIDGGQYVAGDYTVYAVLKATGDRVSQPFTIHYPG